MKASHNLARVSATFDDGSLLASGGLAVTGLLAQRLGVADLVDEHVTLSGAGAANAGAKALTVVGSALAGGDCIDDVDVLGAGATPRLFDGVSAPSTIGTWLRSFAWAGVRQLDRVTRELLVRAWAAGLGPDPDADLTIDIDSSVVQTYGLAKQSGERFCYTGVRGYHPLVASLADTGELLHTRLRGGKAASGRDAAGVMATKPYAASANYINGMTDYCGECRYNPKTRTEADSCPFNSLYWDFLVRNRRQLVRLRDDAWADLGFRSVHGRSADSLEATDRRRTSRQTSSHGRAQNGPDHPDGPARQPSRSRGDRTATR